MSAPIVSGAADQRRNLLGVLTLALLLGTLPLWLNTPYALSTMILIGIYTIVTIGLCLLMGYGGQVSLGQAAFFGLGALIGGPGLWIALGIIVALDFAVLATIIRFGDVSRAAAALLVPYWLWVLYATTLNAAIAVLAG